MLLAGLPGGGDLVAAPQRLALLEEQPGGDEDEEAEVDQRLVLVERELRRLCDTEIAIAANTVVGRLRIRPTTAAASAGSSTPGANPAAAPGCVRVPVSVTLAPASTPVRPHTRVESRPTLMPRRAARSVFSAMARTATPERVKRKKAARPRRSRIATSMAKISGNPKRVGVTADLEVESAERQLVADRVDPRLFVERQRVGVGEERQAGHEPGRRLRQEPGRHDRDHGQHEPGSVEEAPHQGQVEGHADQSRQPEPEHEGDRERHLGVLHEVERQDGAGRADGRLGEVDDPQRAVDEDDAGRGEGVDQAEDEAPEQDGPRRPPPEAAGAGEEDLGVEGNGHHGQRPAHGRPPGGVRPLDPAR